MLNPSKKEEYLKVIKEGFDCYGLNGFYEMHKDVVENPDNTWSYALECLNDLNFEEFELLCKTYLNEIKSCQTH